MSTIRHYPFFNHYLGNSTDYVIHLHNGAQRHAGRGLAFWFRPESSSISDVPASDQELPMLFHAITADHQDIAVQTDVTFRYAKPEAVAQRFDFGIFPIRPAAKRVDGRQQVVTMIKNIAQSCVGDALAAKTLEETLRNGIEQARQVLIDTLGSDIRLAQSGIEVLGVHVLGIRPDGDIEKALQTPLRESLQSEADRATYERRIASVEHERGISEKELAGKIELARQREELVSLEGANTRRENEESAAAALIETKAAAERRLLDAESSAKAVIAKGQATAASEKALMGTYERVDTNTLLALAARDAAQHISGLTNLAISADTLNTLVSALQALGSGSGAKPTSTKDPDADAGMASRNGSGLRQR